MFLSLWVVCLQWRETRKAGENDHRISENFRGALSRLEKHFTIIGYEVPSIDMSSASPQNVTQLLADWSRGEDAALRELTPLVYEELRRLAHHYMGRQRPDHTLQATALVNEAYLRLADQTSPNFTNRSHFFAVAAAERRMPSEKVVEPLSSILKARMRFTVPFGRPIWPSYMHLSANPTRRSR